MTTLTVSGMTCEKCQKAVHDALHNVAGVEKVDVSLEEGKATVEGNAAVSQLIAAVESEGYEASEVEAS